MCPGPAKCVFGGLGRATSSDQDSSVIAVRLIRPQQIGFGAAALVVPGAPISGQIPNGQRYRVALVEVPDGRANGSAGEHGRRALPLIAERARPREEVT